MLTQVEMMMCMEMIVAQVSNLWKKRLEKKSMDDGRGAMTSDRKLERRKTKTKSLER